MSAERDYAAVLAEAFGEDPPVAWDFFPDPDLAIEQIAAHAAAALLASDAHAAVVREAEARAWDEGFDAGERDVWEHAERGYDSPCIASPYRAAREADR